MPRFEKEKETVKEFESLRVGLASKEKILEWSRGEVTKPETINYRTLKPEKDGLFCEKIFGPAKDFECSCGKFKKREHRGIVCDKCGVEVTKKDVRRERMGHIKLAGPVSHIWYFKGVPSRMSLLLDIPPKNLEKVLYFASYVVLEPGDSGLNYKDVIGEEEFRAASETATGSKSKKKFRAEMGAAAIQELLRDVDPEKIVKEIKGEIEGTSGQKHTKLARRLEVAEAFRSSGNKPEWMILDVIPVIPPDLRPMVQLDGGRFATSDLNDLYRRVINRNNRLSKFIDMGAPAIIQRNERRMLQEAVDSLIDNGRRGKAVSGSGGRPLKSLSDMLKGKQGRFRQNLLGKRVDYSGRSVIVVGPELKFYQCGLPKMMALELFKTFIMKKLTEEGLAINIKSAKKMVEEYDDAVWDVLEDVIKEHPVMLNRAPTLHRLGIQAFEPVLVEGKAIKLHPLVCTAFNADFDGDQMAVHLPLSLEAQAEARFLMLSTNNILAPKDGSPITVPTQDMILGSYFLTYGGIESRDTEAEKGDGKCFSDHEEMLMAYMEGIVGIHAKVKVRRHLNKDDKSGKLVESTVGRFILNEKIPQDLGFVNREEDPYALEVDFLCAKDKLREIIDKCYKKHGNTKTAIMLDYIKEMGFRYSTLGAITISISDMEIPEAKKTIIDAAEDEVAKCDEAFENGLYSKEERYGKVINIWDKATNDVADALMDSLGTLNNLYIMAHSGARGSKNQIRQIGGMRGLMANATGKTIEIPIKANFREGLSVLEYFISTNGARKGLADTALRTADSGYLTRRLVDVSHNVIVTEEDCNTDEGVYVEAFTEGKQVIEPLAQRITGRTAAEDILDSDGNIITSKNDEISDDDAKRIEKLGIERVKIRSVMTCECKTGVCAKCYGRNLATGEEVNRGEAVGIMAAQSIGEPGTQLTMRTFHTGGVAGSDITQGLPRVVELFEARQPKGLAEICRADGKVTDILRQGDGKFEVIVSGEEEQRYEIPYGARLSVKKDDEVKAGQNITEGPLYPEDILEHVGVTGVYDYLVKEVQKVYKQQGVDINDKHIEVIVSKMLSKARIITAGDTNLMPGGLYALSEINNANKKAKEEGKKAATSKRVLLGITKASLETDSFLSAASFQETTRMLTDAATKGKKDRLKGLKENVIVGKLVPAGTGMKRYKNIGLDYGVNEVFMEAYEEHKRKLDEEKESLYSFDANIKMEDEERKNIVTEVVDEDVEIEIVKEDNIVVED